MATQGSTILNPRVVSHEEWVTERVAFLAKEKELTRLRDELSRQRRELPWEKVTKQYVFDGPHGRETLAELFDGRSQLVVYHLMFSPAWDEACKSCSFWADNFNGIDIHLAHRDITFLAISRAPLAKLEAYRKEMPGVSVFYQHGDVYHTYSAYSRGIDLLNGAYNYIDLTPKGRDEEGLPDPMAWLRRHDQYED